MTKLSRIIWVSIISVIITYLIEIFELYLLPINISNTDRIDATSYAALFAPIFAIPIVIFILLWSYVLKLQIVSKISLAIIIVITASISRLIILPFTMNSSNDITALYVASVAVSSVMLLYVLKESKRV